MDGLGMIALALVACVTIARVWAFVKGWVNVDE